jgi:hypothetical protein
MSKGKIFKDSVTEGICREGSACYGLKQTPANRNRQISDFSLVAPQIHGYLLIVFFGWLYFHALALATEHGLFRPDQIQGVLP